MLASFSASFVALPQAADYRVSDTLIAGDTTIIRCDIYTGQYSPDEQRASLWPIPEYPWCEGCQPDTFDSYMIALYQDSSIFDYYFAIPLGAIPGEYKVMISCYWHYYWKDFQFYRRCLIMSPPFIFEQTEDITVCPGENAIFIIGLTGSDYLKYKWFRNGAEITGATNNPLVIENVQEQDTGSYFCIISNQYGTDTSDVAKLGIYPVPVAPGPPAGPDRFCPGTQNTIYTINADPLVTGYYWQLYPVSAGTVSPQGATAEINWNAGFNGRAILRVTLQNEFCDVLSDSLLIRIPGPTSSPPICIVGIDEATGKYRIVWEKRESKAIREYKIYRESNMSDVYLEIGSSLQDELSVFVDSTSTPDILPHRYKISVVDTCGSESELSPYHQTMHLTASLGISKDVNLIWSGYMGIAFPAYVIYRGTHPDSMTFLMQVPSTVTSFTDDDPPTGMIYYRVGMSNPAGCLPSRKALPDYNISMSNTEEVLNPSGIEAVNEKVPFMVFPNPAGTELNIQLTQQFPAPARYEVYNSTGALVLEGSVLKPTQKINTSPLPEGIFILKIINETASYSILFVIQKNSKQ